MFTLYIYLRMFLSAKRDPMGLAGVSSLSRRDIDCDQQVDIADVVYDHLRFQL
jgi:hypothetical protein